MGCRSGIIVVMTRTENSGLSFVEASTDEVKNAQEWLLGSSTQEPDLWALAHTVNGYVRAGEPWAESNKWAGERLPMLKSKDGAAEFNTQELLDLLFLFCRAERFCEGTLDALTSEIENIMAVIRERVAGTESRPEK